MKEKRISVCLLLLCVLAMGIIYGKWGNHRNVETDMYAEPSAYGHSGPETYAMVLKSYEGIYPVDMTDMEILNGGTELNIVLEENKARQLLKGDIFEIILSYSIMSISGNPVTDIVISGNNILESEISRNSGSKNLAIVSHVIKPEEAIELYKGNNYEFDAWVEIYGRTGIKQENNKYGTPMIQKLNLHCKINVE
ncbi:MAG: hypothetical protein HFI34_09925 [Lachnospiraceae bacterium]|nr:hypothetical protein [Lachnospiraceae bacterium]